MSARDQPRWAALRTPRWHFIRWDSGKRELYRVSVDAWEQRNLLRQRPAKAKELERRLDNLIRRSAR